MATAGGNDDEIEAQENIFNIQVEALGTILSKRIRKPCRNSLYTGDTYYTELIDERRCHRRRFQEISRMDRLTFLQLLEELSFFGLKDSRKIRAGVKIMIFISICTGHSNRDV